MVLNYIVRIGISGGISYFSETEMKEYSNWLLQQLWWQSKTQSTPGLCSDSIIVTAMWVCSPHETPDCYRELWYSHVPLHFIYLVILSFMTGMRMTQWKQRFLWMGKIKTNTSNKAIKSTQFLTFLCVKYVLLRLTSFVSNRLPSYSLHEARDIHIKHRSFWQLLLP